MIAFPIIANFRNGKLLCKHHENGIENAAKVCVFPPKRFRVNVALVSIIEYVWLVNEGRLLLVIECDGCGY